MSEHKHVIRFDVKTYPCKCGLEFSQEFAETLVEAALSGSLPTVQLGIDLEFEKRKVAELKAHIDRLIEAGKGLLDSLCTDPEEEKTVEVMNWKAVVDKVNKERER